MRLEMLVGVERLVAAFVITAIWFGAWRSVDFTDMGPKLVMLCKRLVAIVFCARKEFGSVVPILVCL